ncbi:carbamoyl-phosphate synthase large subunit [Desulfosporosinus sp. BICA1-9]|uniref:carbamoyl-phosphate synthase large subunit n=1 Tax=Desulfosporosinus sp. BICA1-9 TaxID=1531958 RepID=UPI00054B76C3|nr:carbamoyl-phosphate synthase large subunit [Desulfosporosinus sp. BICA1-9]KJS50677.1 MAG: carbamoyl phosphate synthase large subunit [Peptococcaceae bacterium BRH_c23]KJS83769.1 MAG: carbamoyl phosphate synthase large subunit [Desulfosporosinus sp. BICA1-9]
MPLNPAWKKVLVIGSGPIVIGQAAEFDYAGTQACKALREVGVEVVLVNSNPATIMTDVTMANITYLEPLLPEVLERILSKERPDALLPTLGGQTGLNLAMELERSGILKRYGVELIGCNAETIYKAEDRDAFKETMLSLGEPVAQSVIVTTLEEGEKFAKKQGFPLIIRPAYTLGGTGGGIVKNAKSLEEILQRGLQSSPIGQCLVERSVAGWKEIEYEVMRDDADNCITICNMENIDPVGIHTGDSIVVAPSQTLTDVEYQMLRASSLKIIRALGVNGGCNVQFALNPMSREYVVIEVNPRVSRSSALASKATGYPIAKMAALLSVGFTLPELTNPVTGNTSACFEPALDYVVVKFPRWPFDKFPAADHRLGTQMKATGEVMAMERTLEGALLKATRSLEIGSVGLRIKASGGWTEMEIEDKLVRTDHERFFALAEAFRRDWTILEVQRLTQIDSFYLSKIKDLVSLEQRLQREELSTELLRFAKVQGFSDLAIAKLIGRSEEVVRAMRVALGIIPVYKTVDTCAAEFTSATPYYYSSYEEEDEVAISTGPKVVVLGSGPIRIGQGIEFDYCSVHALSALQEAGVEAIMINNNPETVSTDFDTADKLYFEPLTVEDVLHVLEKEKADGVLVQFGGQTAINLAGRLSLAGIQILGTTVDAIDLAEDRERFAVLLSQLGIPQSEGRSVTSVAQAKKVAEQLEFPLIVRPSYVIGGRAMQVVETLKELEDYLRRAIHLSEDHPILVDRYLEGKEVEVDAVSDGETTVIAGIMEHIERAGVHSGDSSAVYPPQSLTPAEIEQIQDFTCRLALGIGIKGLINIQYVVVRGKVYVLEVNPRASRTVPILSKVTGIPLVNLAVQVSLGKTLKDMGYKHGLAPEVPFVVVKAPVFSFEKLTKVETSLGPEMKSTGEVLGMDTQFGHALAKAFAASHIPLPNDGNILVSVAEKDRPEAIILARQLAQLGFGVKGTGDTAKALALCGVEVEEVSESSEALQEAIRQREFSFILSTPTKGTPERTGYLLRRLAVEHGVPCFTSMDTAKAVVRALHEIRSNTTPQVLSLQEYLAL